MNNLTSNRPLLVFSICLALSAAQLPASNQPHTTAFSETSPDYKRIKLASGRYKPESYVVAEGIKLDHNKNDESLDRIDFAGVAHAVSNALLEADYLPTENYEDTNLLIVIHWGKTYPTVKSSMFGYSSGSTTFGAGTINAAHLDWYPSTPTSTTPGLFYQTQSDFDIYLTSQSFADRMRHQQNAYHAQLLGYANDLNRSTILGQTVLTMKQQQTDLIAQLETPRYFVILQAYDFQKIKKEKTKKMLWSTRFSIRAKGRNFDESLLSMALAASRVFGKDTDYLKSHLTPARVEFGELEYLGSEEH